MSVTITGSGFNGSLTGAATLNVLDAGDTMTGALTINMPAGNIQALFLNTSGATSTLTITDTGQYGAGFRLTGNGATTPSKFLRAQGGLFQIMNDAYNKAIFGIDDTGNVTITNTASITSSGSSQSLLISDQGGLGASIRLFGNGSATPNKYIRAQNGQLFIVNDAANTVIFALNDVGGLAINGTMTASSFSGSGASLTGTASSLTAASANKLNGAAFTNGTDGWFRSTSSTGWFNETYSVGIWATEAGNVRTYNGANFIANNITGVVGTFNSTNTASALNLYSAASTQTVFVQDTGANGANIRLYGNGGTPSKYIRACNGAFQIMADNYTSIFYLDNAGNLTLAGTLQGAASLNVLKTGDTMTGSLTINGGNTPLSLVGDGSANLHMNAGGGANPSKSIRSLSGNLELINSAYSAVIFQWQDAGPCVAFGPMYANSYNLNSSFKIKKNIKDLDKIYLSRFSQLRPVEFDRKNNNRHEFGFIAEEMIKIYPEIVEHDEVNKTYGVDYGKLATILTAKVQEQQSTIDKLHDTIDKLQEQMSQAILTMNKLADK